MCSHLCVPVQGCVVHIRAELLMSLFIVHIRAESRLLMSCSQERATTSREGLACVYVRACVCVCVCVRMCLYMCRHSTSGWLGTLGCSDLDVQTWMFRLSWVVDAQIVMGRKMVSGACQGARRRDGVQADKTCSSAGR